LNLEASIMELGVDPATLKAEGEWMHLSIFGCPIPEPVLKHYIEAHSFYLTLPDATQVRWLAEALRLKLDVEALEIILRFSHQDHLLVRKIKILVHIAEAFEAYRFRFINEQPQRMKAFILLTYHGVRTAWKFCKGKFLCRRLKRLV
jgi:hypothetical protein